MGLPRLTQRRVALLCAIILVALVIGVFVKQSNADDGKTAQNNSRPAATAENEKAEPAPAKPTPQESENEIAKEPVINKDDSSNAAIEDKKKDENTSTAKKYEYVAKPGDSFTQFARDALQQYATAQHVQLSDSELLSAEVALANAAGSPELEIGQNVHITSADITAVLDDKPEAAPTQDQDKEPQTVAEPKPETTQKQPETKESTKQPVKTDDYTYTAEAGSSYTMLARDAVQQYTKAHNIELSSAQRIAAETTMAQAANEPQLNVGEIVQLKQQDVKAAVDTAASLTAEQQQLWQPFVVATTL